MSLKSTQKIGECLHSIEFDISAEVFEAAQAKAFAKKKKNIQIPGFRKGKVTRKMAEGFFGKAWLYEDAIDLCYGEALDAAIKESELEVVDTKSADIKEIGENGVVLVCEVYTKPVVEIGAYKELKATKKKVEATAEEVDARIEEMRQRNARLDVVEGRAAADGDIAVIDFEGFLDGVAFEGGKGENYDLTLGAGQFIPGFEDQIVGHNAGDEFDIDVTFPEEYTPELAGKKAVFKIKLHEIKVNELPEVDDEFAQEAADCDTVDEMKKQIASEIKAHKEDENKREIESQLLAKVAEALTGEIPEIYYEREIDNQIRDLDYRFSMQGLSFETYLQYTGMTMEAYREQAKESAVRNVKVRLALDLIAAAEGLDCTEEEIEAEYEKFAQQYSMPVEEIKKVVSVDALKEDMLKEKAIEFVVASAKVTTARKPRTKKEEAAPAEEAEESAE